METFTQADLLRQPHTIVSGKFAKRIKDIIRASEQPKVFGRPMPRRNKRRNGNGRAAKRIRGRYARKKNGYGRNGCGSGEVKFFDIVVDDAVVAAAGTITDSVVKIPQGITESTRVGRRICVTNIGWRYRSAVPGLAAQATPPDGDTVRVILFVDHQCNGATTTVISILELASYQAFNNLSNKGRFTILMDRTFDLNYLAGVGITASQDYAANLMNGTFFKRCSIPIEYSAATGGITEIKTNNIGVLLISSKGKANFESVMRIRFTDN